MQFIEFMGWVGIGTWTVLGYRIIRKTYNRVDEHLKAKAAEADRRWFALHNDPLGGMLCPRCLGYMKGMSDGTPYCPDTSCPYFSEQSSITLRPFTQPELNALDAYKANKSTKSSKKKGKHKKR